MPLNTLGRPQRWDMCAGPPARIHARARAPKHTHTHTHTYTLAWKVPRAAVAAWPCPGMRGTSRQAPAAAPPVQRQHFTLHTNWSNRQQQLVFRVGMLANRHDGWEAVPCCGDEFSGVCCQHTCALVWVCQHSYSIVGCANTLLQ
jgi:hypothetical protein